MLPVKFRNLIPRLGRDRGFIDTVTPFNSITSDLEKVFNRFMEDLDIDFWGGRSEALSPDIDLIDGENEVKVIAELPGLTEKDVDVSISNGRLTIKGEKKSENEKNSDGYYSKECSYGRFERSINLGEGLDLEKVEAGLKNGVLTVKVPKLQEAKREIKKIAVKTE
ncbi:MAG: Hsp20/alpha crystallin family protein [Nitrospirae bacterium]|nr:Hsp20/alpha crystallin family protein [Nitrospirota bacterium]